MDRSLDPERLARALGDLAGMPSAAELQELLATAEIAAFFGAGSEISNELLTTAWTLHQVGTVRPELEIYGLARQVEANAVASHIFDLALNNNGLSYGERLVLTFAAQVSSVRGDRAPNASALARRLVLEPAQVAEAPGQSSLELGCVLLGMNRADTVRLLRGRRAAIRTRERLQQDDSWLRVSDLVVDASESLLAYLTFGDASDLERARGRYLRASQGEGASRDLDSRWVSAHLLDLCDDLGGSSVWSLLPEGTPPSVGQAMTLGDPPVLTLWPPQVALLREPEVGPLRRDAKRVILTFPTSAGKTLLTQLLAVHHLATSNTGVCIVAPSHSLCREIRAGLDRRLWLLRREVEEDGPLGDAETPMPSVLVTTPERFAARLRTDADALLDQYGLFVFDEAHLIGDSSRGWSLEAALSRLHQLTTGTDHRMVVASAALGGTTAVRSWLDSDPGAVASARWRGPRRLFATYGAEEQTRESHAEPPQGRQRDSRLHIPLTGVARLYVGAGEAIAARGAPLQEIVYNARSRAKISGPSVAEQLQPIVELAAFSGPVLTIHSTKRGAELLARQLASTRVEDARNSSLVALARLRLGTTHPIVGMLARGVAYHHAALPTDIQIEIENSYRQGRLQVICSTTTLIEGVNLPVRTVVVCDRGYRDGAGFNTLIDSAHLMNAAGRAGRAGRETEGWTIIVQQSGGPNARQALLELDEDQPVLSVLAQAEGLRSLSEYELLLADTAGVVLRGVPPVVDDFMSHCWYLAEAAFVTGGASSVEAVVSGIQDTLAWQQLPDDIRGRWVALGERVAAQYDITDPHQRRRWAATGHGLSRNQVLESVASAFGAEASTLNSESDPAVVLAALLDSGRLEALLSMLPERDRRFKERRSGRVQVVRVDLRGLILDWLRGRDLTELADSYLAAVVDDDFRFEQLSGFLTRVCEHHLPWVCGTILAWLRSDSGIELVPRLPALLHFGVDSEIALELMTNGVRSRRLAVTVATVAESQGVGLDEVVAWLDGLDAITWPAVFDAGPAEIADLTTFVGRRGSGLSRRLLDGESVTIWISGDPSGDPETFGHLAQRVTTDGSAEVVLAVRGEGVLGTVSARDQYSIALVMDAGFVVSAAWARDAAGPAWPVSITLAD